MCTQPKLNACRIYINNQQIKANLQRYSSIGIWMYPKQFFAKLIRLCLLFCLFVRLRLLINNFAIDVAIAWMRWAKKWKSNRRFEKQKTIFLVHKIKIEIWFGNLNLRNGEWILNVEILMPKVNPKSFVDDYLQKMGIEYPQSYMNVTRCHLEEPSRYVNIDMATHRLKMAIDGKQKVGIIQD